MSQTIRLPLKFFGDSVEYGQDSADSTYICVQANDSSRPPGAVLYKIGNDNVPHEIMAPGAASYFKCKVRRRNNGTGILIGADASLLISIWDVPGWVP